MNNDNLWILYLNTSLWVRRLFQGKVDKGNSPYIDHLLFVSNNMSTLEGKILGLLHDCVEDIEGITFEFLLTQGYPQNIVDALKLVTRDKSIPYEEYIERIATSKNLLAIELKKCDLEHNMDISRIKNPTEKDYKRLQKYNRSYDQITSAYTQQRNLPFSPKVYQKLQSVSS